MVSGRSGSSRTLWKSTNSQNRKEIIDAWDGSANALTPMQAWRKIGGAADDVTDAAIISMLNMDLPLLPGVSKRDLYKFKRLPVTVEYMYQALRKPLCTVAADKETKERIRKIAFAMQRKEPVPRTQRDRLVRLLTRLTGGKHANRNASTRRETTSCGFNPSLKYRLIDDDEMNKLGFTSTVGAANKHKFFYKAKRQGLWTRNDKKFRVREYKAPPPKAGKNGHVPASKPLRVPQRIVQRGLMQNARNSAAPWHRNPDEKWSGAASSGVWKERSNVPASSPRRRSATPSSIPAPSPRRRSATHAPSPPRRSPTHALSLRRSATPASNTTETNNNYDNRLASYMDPTYWNRRPPAPRRSPAPAPRPPRPPRLPRPPARNARNARSGRINFDSLYMQNGPQ
jgi:hypothetical protein